MSIPTQKQEPLDIIDNATGHRRRQLLLMSLVAVAAVLANLPQPLSQALGLQREYLLAVLGIVTILGFFLYSRFSLFLLTVLLALGANLPDRWAQAFGINTLPLIVALLVMILAAMINQATKLLPSGLEIHADAKLKSADGTHALVSAINRGQSKVIRSIVRYSSLDLDQADEDGITPLQAAAARGDRAIVELLLSCGANPFVVGKDGRTGATIAEASGNHSLADYLRGAEARFTPRRSDDRQ